MWTSGSRRNHKNGPVRCALTLAVTLAVPASAHATGSCFENPDCSTLLTKGKQAHKERRYADALGLYQAAYEKVPDPLLLVLRGRSFFKLGQPERALDLYRAALPQLKNEAERSDAEQFIRQAEEAARAKVGTTGSASATTTASAPNLLAPPATTPSFALTAAVPGTESTKPRAADQPVYKRWWFWTLVGVAAAGVATGIGLGIASREPDTTGLMEYHP